MFDRRALLAVAALGLAGAPALAPSARAQDDRARLLDTLLDLEAGSWQFVKDKNADRMNGFLADDAVLLFFDGSRYTKARMVKFEFDLASFNVDRGSAQVLMASPDVAVLLYNVTSTAGPKGGKMTTATVSASDVYARRGSKWLSLYYQETRLQ